jgi:hypothetical protein
VRQASIVRLAVLVAALACVAIAFGRLPALRTGTELAPAPAVIVNDTPAAVVAVHCSPGCVGDGTVIDPGHELPAGPPGARWQLRSAGGDVIGCLAASSSGQRLRVSRASGCPA